MKQINIQVHKLFNDYKNKMIWLMNTDYSKQRKMVIALDMFERTMVKLNKLNKLNKFDKKHQTHKLKSPLDT